MDRLGELAHAGGGLRPSTAPAAQDADTARDFIGDVVARGLPFPQARQLVLGAFEERYVDAMLAKFGNNISKAAAASGVARRYFYTVRARHGR